MDVFSSAPVLFSPVLFKSNKEDGYEVSVFTLRVVMSPMMLILSEALISLTLMASLKMSLNHATQHLFILQLSRSVSLIHC